MDTSERFAKLSENMKRDILFMDSLYYIRDVKEDLNEQEGDDQYDSDDDSDLEDSDEST